MLVEESAPFQRLDSKQSFEVGTMPLLQDLKLSDFAMDIV